MSHIDGYSLRPGSWPWDHHQRAAERARRVARQHRRRQAVRRSIRRFLDAR